MWGTDLADMKFTYEFNTGFRFLLCVIDIYSKYAWVIALKDKKGNKITNGFQKTLDKPKCKPCEIWADEGSEFCNKSINHFCRIMI